MFPIAGVLLLPGGNMPLNIFEPRYLEMTADVLASHHLVGIIQPCLSSTVEANGDPKLCKTGCLGRLTDYQETGDGRLLISISGICRFKLGSEVPSGRQYRKFRFDVEHADLEARDFGDDVDREALLGAFRDYVETHGHTADWNMIEKTDNATLVTVLSMISPFGPAEKQALLEADNHKARAETLVAITEMELARNCGGAPSGVQ